MIRYKIIISIFLFLSIIGCGKEQLDTQTEGLLKVVATTGMIGDAVKMIAGDNVQLTTLMGPGVDPHLYKSTKKDMDNLAKADLIFYNGLHLESKMAEVLKKMSSSKQTFAVAETIDSASILYLSDFEGAPDPHIWFNVSLWKQAVQNIGHKLIELDKENTSTYQSNLNRYLDSLEALHEEVKNNILSIPEEQRILITAHDAFGYFGNAYGIEVKGLQGLSTVTEAGLYDVTVMIDMLVSKKIKAVFVESSVPQKALEAVVTGCRDKNHDIIIGGELFSDAMGAYGTPEGTYIGMVRHNVKTIVSALK